MAHPADVIKKREQELAEMDEALTNDPIEHEDPRYFAFHKAPGDPRGGDPVADLRATIKRSQRIKPQRSTCQLFSGFRGSGKSTELHRLAGELTNAGHVVVFVAGNEVINLFQPLEPTDLLVSVAGAVAVEIARRTGASPAQQPLLQRIAGFFRDTDVNLTTIAFDGGPAKLTFALARDPMFKAKVQQALRGRLSEFVGQFQAFMAEATKLLAIPDGGPYPVIIVDDLEKVRGLGQEQAIVQKGMEEIFWSFHWALRVEGWHTVWTAPPYIQLLNPGVGRSYDESVVLPMIRVWSNDQARTPDNDGVAAMRAAARLRGDIDSLFFSDALLDRLIVASSGHVRDFVGLLRDAVRQVDKQTDPTRVLNEIAIDRIVADYSSDYRKAIYGDDVPWLATVAADRKLKLPNVDLLPRVAKLLDMSVVMTYRNGEDWVDLCAPAHRLV
jgi:hypothetical protein